MATVASFTHAGFTNTVRRFEEQDETFVADLRLLFTRCEQISSFCGEYDFRADVPGNGFRSFLAIIMAYFDELARINGAVLNKKSRAQLDIFLAMRRLLLDISLNMIKLHARGKQTGNVQTDYFNESSLDRELMTQVLALREESILPFIGPDGNFWLENSIRRVLNRVYVPMVVFYSDSPKRSLTRHHLRAEIYAKFALNATWADVRKVWGFSGSKLQRFVTNLQYGSRPRVQQVLQVPRQTEYSIGSNGVVSHTNEVCQSSESIRCLFLQDTNFGVSGDDSLLLHIHGGGFFALSPEAHENYLRRWAIKLRVPILSVDYSLSPEVKYPTSLQELLDVYLFLVSGSGSVKELLGFQPKKIVLCGDSAGGYFSIALTLVLSDVRRLSLDRIPFPSALCIQYPAAQPAIPVHSASRLLIVLDTLLTVSAVYSAGEAYTNCGNDLADTMVRPWYRHDETREKTVQVMIGKLNDPHYNLLSKKVSELPANLPLFIQASQFDPLLDDSVSLAKLWNGMCIRLHSHNRHYSLGFSFQDQLNSISWKAWPTAF